MTHEETIKKVKSDKRVQKYMKQYRYNYGVKMLPDLAELAYSFYLEGYNNGLGQYPVEQEGSVT